MTQTQSTIGSLMQWGTAQLGQECQYDVRLLLSAALSKPLSHLVAHKDAIPTAAESNVFRAWIQRRQQHEPVAYILGEVGFGPRMYHIESDVLVPRPETELLVDEALNVIPHDANALVLECGVGSGVVCCEIALARPKVIVKGWDVNPKAVSVARANIQRHGVANVAVWQGDFFAAIAGLMPLPSDDPIVLVSNPPYIPTSDIATLDDTVRSYESHMALDGGPTGLSFYDEFIRFMTQCMAVHCSVTLCCEIGIHQDVPLREMCKAAGIGVPRFIADLNGINRVMVLATVEYNN